MYLSLNEMEVLRMFSKRLQFLMDRENYNQAKLAELLGVSAPAVSKILKDGVASVETLKKLRKIFNVSIDYLLGLDIDDTMEVLNRHDFKEVVAKIIEIREDKKLTQKEFAKYNDIDTQEIIDLENGKAPSLEVLQKISYYSGIDLYRLMGEQSQPITTNDIEYKNILKFAANLENKEYIEIAMSIKESGVNPNDIVISKKL
jgi:transcriptional regulator with XRE-family HTH domain